MSEWCIVAIVALVVGGISSMVIKDKDCFAASVALTILIGLSHLITLGV